LAFLEGGILDDLLRDLVQELDLAHLQQLDRLLQAPAS
jgi:hypothetical protein